MAKKAKQPGLNKTLTAEELEKKRILAVRYETPIVEPEIDEDAERKKFEAAEKKRKAKYAADIEEGQRERMGEEVRIGANPERVAAAIAAQTRKIVPMTPEQRERKRQADIAQARATRYGEVVVVGGSDNPNATPEQIAEREAAWDKR